MNKSSEPREGLELLREILVGAIQRDLDRRVTRAESHSAARVTELQQEMRRRIDVIEAHVQKDADAQRDLASSLEQRVAKLEEAIARAQHDLRQELLHQAKAFLDELHNIRAELLEAIDRELAAFEDDFTEEPVRREPREQQPSPAP